MVRLENEDWRRSVEASKNHRSRGVFEGGRLSIGVWRLSTVDGLKLEELKEARRGDCTQTWAGWGGGEEERRMGEGSNFCLFVIDGSRIRKCKCEMRIQESG